MTYDKRDSTALIPNRERSQEFLNAVDDSEWSGLIQALNRSEELLHDTWALDEDAAANQSSGLCI